MKKLISIVVIALFMVITVMAYIASAEIKLGILPRLSSEALYGMFKPLAEYLTNETGEKVSIVIPKDFDAFKEAIKSGQADIGFVNVSDKDYGQLRQAARLAGAF